MPEPNATTEKPLSHFHARTLLLRLPIFCCIFTFLYWLIFFPLLWDAMIKSNYTRLRFNISCIITFLVWLLVMFLCMSFWFYNNKKMVPMYPNYGTTENGVGYETKLAEVQPKSRTDLNAYPETVVKLDKKNELRTSKIIMQQEQVTPAMYNQHTGRSSVERDESHQPLLKKKDIPFRSISLSDSERSIKDSDQVQVRTTVETLPTQDFPKKIILHSDSDSYFNTPTPAEDGNIFQFPKPERGGPAFVDHEMEEFAATMDNYTPDPDRISQHLPEFDNYLHLTALETPLSPREVFFSDLIKQANETEGQMLKSAESDVKRRSFNEGDLEFTKLNYDPRKSVPLFLYSDKWKNVEKTEEIGSLPTPYESAEDILVEQVTEPEVSSPRVVGTSPKRLTEIDVRDIDSIITITEMMISTEQRHSCTQPLVANPRVRDVEEFEGGSDPKLRGKPQKQISFDEERSQVLEIVEPEERVLTRKESQGAYFIAAVTRPKSVTSEVFITIDSDLKVTEKKWELKSVNKSGTKSEGESDGAGKFVILDEQNMKAELELVLPEDDDVFVDVQSSLGKLKSKRGEK